MELPWVGIALSSAAVLLVARNLDSPELLTLAFFLPMTLLPNLTGPEGFGVMLSLSGLALAFVARRDDRGRYAAMASWTAALIAPMLQWALQTESSGLLGVTLLVAALTMFIGGRRTIYGDAMTIVCVALAALPVGGIHQPLPWMTPELTSGLAFAASIGATFFSVRDGRSWRTALIASLAVALSALTGHYGIAAATALIASRALLPSIGVPIAAVFALAAFHTGYEPLALCVGFSLIALLEEHDFTWTHVLGRHSVSWAASLSSLVLLGASLFQSPLFGTAPIAIIGSLCVLLWVRATRFPLFAALIPGLILFAAHTIWPAALAVVVLTRVLQHAPIARTWLLGDHAPRFTWVQNALTGSLAVLAAVLVAQGELGALPAAIALLVAAGEPTAWRVVAAAGFSLAVPQLYVAAAAVLLAIAFLARHRPVAAQWLLGGRDRTWTVAAAALSSLSCAVFAVTAQPTSFPIAGALAVCLVGCAVLLGVRWLLTAAVLVVALRPATARLAGPCCRCSIASPLR